MSDDSTTGADSSSIEPETAWLGTPPSVNEIREKINGADDHAELSAAFDHNEEKVDAAIEILDAELSEHSQEKAELREKKERQEGLIARHEPMIQVARDSATAVLSEKTGVPESHYSDLDTMGLIDATERLGVTEELIDETARLTAERNVPEQEAALAAENDIGCPECGATSTSPTLGDPGPDGQSARGEAVLAGEGGSDADDLASSALLAEDIEGLNIDEYTDTPPSWYVSEVYGVDVDEFDHGDDLRAELADKRGTPEVQRRRRRVHSQLKEHRDDRLRIEANRELSDSDGPSLLADDSPSYDSLSALARRSLGGEDTAMLAETGVDPAEYVRDVYGLSPSAFGDEFALREAIQEADDTEADHERRALLRDHRDRQDAELRSKLADGSADSDTDDSDDPDDPPAPTP